MLSMSTMNGESEAGPRHPIGVVAERTGITQELLRVWERRYGAVTPLRSEGGQRLYSNADVERLRLLRRATQGGRPIGAVARLPLPELARLVSEDEAERGVRERGRGAGFPGMEMDLDAALEHARALDAGALEVLLRRTAALMGAAEFLERMVAPFLRRIGEEWHAGRLSPAREHAATGVVQRVVSGVLGQMSPPDDAPVFLVGGPAGDRHEMGSLLAAATAAAERWRVIYLGPDLPARDIVEAAASSGARAVGLSVVFVDDRERVLRELREVRERLPASVPLVIGGGAAAPLEGELEHPSTRVVADLEGLRAALRGWSRPEGP
jgi:MerR family transcriptional regulator, light-induced transcriptional regulator